MITISKLPDCCWMYIQGINTNLNTDEVRNKLLNVLATRFSHKQGFIAPRDFPGAFVFCGAYGGGAMALNGSTTNKDKVQASLERLCTWIEEEGLGEITELPNFINHRHSSNVESCLWTVDNKGMKKAFTKWLNVVPEDEWRVVKNTRSPTLSWRI